MWKRALFFFFLSEYWISQPEVQFQYFSWVMWRNYNENKPLSKSSLSFLCEFHFVDL